MKYYRAFKSLHLNYTWKGVYIWLKGRKRSERRGWKRLFDEPEIVEHEQQENADGNF